ncbi:SDR family oxidoreductase [Streptomyces sp. NPDC058052]|uniref:SDR family oxidoreductase n=1 Tax=Streptomyces sp. NPDC058052 TaxID=3346316 RepID=UPI0036EF46B2
MTFLVTGVRGRVGASVLRRLRAAAVDARGASGAPGAAGPVSGEAPVHLDLGVPETFAPALDGIRKVFLYARPDTAERFAREAVAAGVEHVVLFSSLAIDEDGAEHSPIARLHRGAEDALRASGLDWTFLRAGALASNALQWADPIRAGRGVRVAYPETYSEPVHEEDVAEVGVRALLDDAHRGEVLRITGPESLSARQQAELIAAAAGVGVPVERVARAEHRAVLTTVLPEPVADFLLDFQRERDGLPGTPLPDAERVLGRGAAPFAQWAREHAAAFR